MGVAVRNSSRSLGKLNLTHSFKAPHQQAGIAGAQDVVPEQVQLHFSISPMGSRGAMSTQAQGPSLGATAWSRHQAHLDPTLPTLLIWVQIPLFFLLRGQGTGRRWQINVYMTNCLGLLDGFIFTPHESHS